MNQPYTIFFERSGGFTGIPLSVQVSSVELAKKDRDRLDKLMVESDICNLKNIKNENSAIRDQFDYLIRVKCDTVEKQFSFSDNTVPTDFLPLINYLLQLALWKKS